MQAILKRSFVVVLAFLVALTCLISVVPDPEAKAASTTIFSDSFDSGIGSAWINQAASYSTTTHAPFLGVDNAYLQTSINTLGYKDVIVQYNRYTYADMPASSVFYSEWSVDGQNWTQLEQITTSEAAPTTVQFLLPASAANQSALQIRYRATGNSLTSTYRYNVDNVVVTGTAITSVTLFNDTFATNTLSSNWGSTTAGYSSGGYAFLGANNATMTHTFNTNGYEYVAISFKSWTYSSMPSGTQMTASYSTDGGTTWVDFYKLAVAQSSITNVNAAFPDAVSNQSNVLLRFVATGNGLTSTYRFNMDDVKVTGVALPSSASYDTIRTKWYNSVVGTSYDTSDTNVQTLIASRNSAAQTWWNAMDKSSSRTYIFSDYPNDTYSENVTNTYSKLLKMAVAYQTVGGTYYHNTQLRSDIISAMDWLQSNGWYNDQRPFAPKTTDNNWFSWELGVPLYLTDLLVVMYNDLTSTQIASNVSAILHFLPTPLSLGVSVNATYTSDGGNLALAARITTKCGILIKDHARIKLGTGAISSLYLYVDPGKNGFAEDGSFLFHDGLPYTYGYGMGSLDDPVSATFLFEGSPWEIADPNKYAPVNWIKNAFEPFLYHARYDDNLTGRYISRPSSSDQARFLITTALNAIQYAKATDRVYLKSLIKYISSQYSDYLPQLSQYADYKQIMNDTSVAPLQPSSFFNVFSGMDRAVQRQSTYSFDISMHSDRTKNYESINNENIAGWHTSDGRTSLHNADDNQYVGGYWATIDPTRLPGTTVQQHMSDNISITGSSGTFVDPLNDTSKIYNITSSRFTIDTQNAANMNNDAARLVRTTDSNETVTYNVNGMTNFSIDFYYTGFSNYNRIRLYGGSTFSSATNIPYKITNAGTTNGWTHAVFTPLNSISSSGYNYLKITLLPSDRSGYGTQSWAGGAEVDQLYGAAGMDLKTNSQSLAAKKSWFLFDNEIVAMGTGISSTDNRTVETIVENRKLSSAGTEQFLVDNAAKVGTLGATGSVTGASWAHLSNSNSGAQIGYYFPGGANLTLKREARSGKFSDIGSGTDSSYTTSYTNKFLTMWFDHGVNPTAGSYQYVLLPGRTPAQVSSYAASPDITILQQDASIHAAKETTQNVVGANFWTDNTATLQVNGTNFLTSTKKASVITHETSTGISVGISDPTQDNVKNGATSDGYIMLTINRKATSVISSDARIQVLQMSPTIQLKVNVDGTFGQTLHASFGY